MSDWILKLTGSTVEAGSEVVGYGVETAGGVAWGCLLNKRPPARGFWCFCD